MGANKIEIRISWTLLLLTVLSLGGYANSLRNEFVWDDEILVKKNWSIRNLSLDSSISPAPMRPITNLSFAIDFKLWRLNPFGYHLTNILLHTINTLLFFLLLSHIFKERKTALISSLVFSLHPVHTEAVSALLGRSDLLSFMFFCLGLFLYIKMEDHSGIRKAFLYSGVLLSYLISILSKEIGFTLPLLMALYDLSFKSERKNLFKKAPYYLPFLSIALFYIIIRFFKIETVHSEPYWGGSLYNTFLMMTTVVLEYLKILFFPLSLNSWYVTPVRNSLFDPMAMASIVIISIILMLTLILFKRRKEISFGISWFFITLLPISNIVPIHGTMMAERWLYLPSAGFSIAIGFLINKVFEKEGIGSALLLRRGLMLLFIGLLGFYSVRTVTRNMDWRNEFILFKKMVESSPRSEFAHVNLGSTYTAQRRFDLALREAGKALEIKPDSPIAHYLLAGIYANQGMNEMAVKEYRIAIELNPNYPEAHYGLGNIYHLEGIHDRAIEEYRLTTAGNPYYINAYNNLGNIYSERGLYEEAIEEYKKVTALDPDNVLARFNLGIVYSRKGMDDDAIEEFERAIKVKPDFVQPLANLAMIYEKKDKNRALEYWQRVIFYEKDTAMRDQVLSHIREIQNISPKAQQ